MAEAIFNNLTSDFKSISCGLKTISGYPATQNAQKACNRNGISLKNHITQKANSELLKNRIVIGMTQTHINQIKILYPESEFYLLTEVGSGSGKDIFDPVKEGFKSHLNVFNLLRKEIICFLGSGQYLKSNSIISIKK